MTVKTRIDRGVVRGAGETVRYLVVSLEGPEAAGARRRATVNLALVLDRSGSMGGPKLDHAREAAQKMLEVLRPTDRIAAVAYDHEVMVVTPSSPATLAVKAETARALGRLEARGNTNLSGGWLKGCEQIALQLDREQLGRCLLLTDGLANEGVREPAELEQHARELALRGIATTTFGVGADFDERLLRRIAEAGRGNFYYIAEAAQIPDMIRAEVDEALETTAHDVVVAITTDPAARVVSLNGLSDASGDGATRFAVGSLVAGQQLELTFEITVPAGATPARVDVAVQDRDGTLSRGTFTHTLARVGDAEHDAAAADDDVVAGALSLRVARATRAALERNRMGDYDGAKRLLQDEAASLARVAPGHRSIGALCEELAAKAEELSVRLDARSAKMRHFAEHSKMKGRSDAGRAVRKGSPATASQAVGPALALVPLSDGLGQIVTRALDAIEKAGIGDIVQSAALQAASEAPGRLSKADEQTLTEGARGLDGQVKLLVTARGLDDNWFSHWHGAERVAFASLHGWESTAHVSAEAFVAYEALHYLLYARSPSYDHRALHHDDTRGCIYDFCRDKAEIEVKLQAADFCPRCAEQLALWGIDVRPLAPFCEVIRRLASVR